ncbi:creatininase family protein [Maricaulis sp.]|uniref:creatininase family protein n=1 Tax=Maricaulis sp. TaxID=1486257 RepID=UPI00262D4110|nr:creatininase family protein [Maricaulis sp.]
MLLHQTSWPEIETYLGRCQGILVPIGSTEQHGPTGLIGTDALCPEIIAHEAAIEAGFLVAPTFNVGMAQHHLAFPGSITLRPSTMIAALNDWIASLAGHGFKQIYFFNGHGGNITTLNAAFSEYYATWSMRGEPCPIVLKQRNWWELAGVMDTCRQLFPSGDGSHATASEISVTLHGYPHSAKTAAMSPRIAADGPFTDAADFRASFPDGRCGSDPAMASREAGTRIVRAAKTALIGEIQNFFDLPPKAQAAE